MNHKEALSKLEIDWGKLFVQDIKPLLSETDKPNGLFPINDAYTIVWEQTNSLQYGTWLLLHDGGEIIYEATSALGLSQQIVEKQVKTQKVYEYPVEDRAISLLFSEGQLRKLWQLEEDGEFTTGSLRLKLQNKQDQKPIWATYKKERGDCLRLHVNDGWNVSIAVHDIFSSLDIGD